jgi:hypothetical protein
MSHHDILVLRMMTGTIISGISLIFLAYGLGLIWRSWGWWHL